MAATLRMNRPAVVGIGAFGQHVANVLGAHFPNGAILPGDDLPGVFDAGLDAVVLALWRPAPALCDQADQLAHVSGIPWLPIVAEHPHLVIGPWISPGRGPCFDCYRRRRVQHDAEWETTRAIHEAYDLDPQCGPAGFLPQHARLAAGVAAGYMRQFSRDESRVAGRVTAISLQRLTPVSYRVVACHDCERCGPGNEKHDLRSRLRLHMTERTGAY